MGHGGVVSPPAPRDVCSPGGRQVHGAGDSGWRLLPLPRPGRGPARGTIVLVELRDAVDGETGQRYTVKRYGSEKAKEGDSWHHDRIILRPVNPAFEPIVLTGADEGEVQVVAELVQVLKDAS